MKHHSPNLYFPCVSKAFSLLVCLVWLNNRFEHDRCIKNSKKIRKNISYIESYSPDLIIIKLNISLRFKSLLLLPTLCKHVQDLDQAFTYQRKKRFWKNINPFSSYSWNTMHSEYCKCWFTGDPRQRAWTWRPPSVEWNFTCICIGSSERGDHRQRA